MSIPPVSSNTPLDPQSPLSVVESVSSEESKKFAALTKEEPTSTQPEGISTEELNRRLAESNKRFTFQQMIESVRRNETEMRRQIMEREKEDKALNRYQE